MSLITVFNPPIARLQLNAPGTLNALSLGIAKSLSQVLDRCENDPEIKVVIIESLVDKAFSVGIDLKEFSVNNAEYRQEFLAYMSRVSAYTKPIIAALNGYVFGGGLELALMADILIATDSAVFSQPELSVGTIPGMGATQHLPRRIGMPRAAQMVFTCAKIDAARALNWGLVTNVVPSHHLHQTVTEAANLVASKSLPMLIHAKAALRSAYEMPLTRGLNHERDLFLSTFDLEDQHEGFEAFLQKRPPVFNDR